MKKFSFEMAPLVLFANSIEEALGQVGSHISTVARHVASERLLEDCKPKFSISELDAPKPEELNEINPEDHVHFDHATAKHGPIPLNLDPTSSAGIAHAKQQTDRKTVAEAAAKAIAKDTRTDAENLALHSEAEQAAHAKV